MHDHMGGRWHRGGRAALVIVVTSLLGLGLAPTLPDASADPEVARFLLEQAKKDVSTGRLDEAIQRLERAREEDPTLLEAHFTLGQAQEKAKNPSDALGAYRSLRDACRAAVEAGETLDARATRWLKTAEGRIAILGKNEAELDAVDQSFAQAVMDFARKHAEEDPDIAAQALRRLLVVLPGYEAALTLLQEVTGEGDVAAPGSRPPDGAPPIPGIDEWVDLLAKRAIVPGHDTQYKRGILTIDNEDGSVYWGPDARAPDTFVLQMEFRVVKQYRPGSLVGFAFAKGEEAARRGDTEFVTAFAQQSSVVLVQASGGKNTTLAEAASPPVNVGEWHVLTVAVEGRKVRLYLDGKRLINSTVPGRKDLAGPFGVFHQRAVAEIRVMKLGVK